MIDRIERARQFRKSGVAWATTATDAEASTVPSLYEGMKYDGKLIRAGTRIPWGDKLMKAAVDLWDTEKNNPDNAPELWEELKYKDGIRIIPTEITVTSAFSEGELGYWEEDESIYKSKVNNNVYTPAQYPDNWTKEEAGCSPLHEVIVTVVQACSYITTISAAVILLIKPIRKKVLGTKNEEDGMKCLLRSDMMKTYYHHREEKKIRQFEYENFILEYKAYKAKGGNSFIDHIKEQVDEWEVVS